MLIRARKYGLVDFDGEMLYQRQDDEKISSGPDPASDFISAVLRDVSSEMNSTAAGMMPASDKLVQNMLDLLSVNLALFLLGFLCVAFNAPLLYILLASRKIREDSKAVSRLRDSLRHVRRTTPNTVHTVIVCDRISPSLCRSLRLCAVSVVLVLSFCIAGLAFAISRANKGYAKFDCGVLIFISQSCRRSLCV
ncbi:unnamed protein product [Angiostrongylus costaricensis]|uniref:Costars domain-containing protein n=1 Tax=Angiostrongylus costaricensis TaxID=334426 RepID=A0A158PMJ4_ANGCS|nr:unnamed protein product [Angiostrongylus costaricensis]